MHLLKSLLPLLLSPAVLADELDILSGQHIIYAYDGTTVPDSLLSATSQGLVAGVLLFGANFDSNTPAQLEKLKAAYNASPAPALLKSKTGFDTHFLVMTDQEGGEVRRIKPGQPNQSAKAVGASADPAAAGGSTGAGAADTLLGVQHNSNLAPVVDVYRQAGDFTDQYERSYGNTSHAVSVPSAAFIKAQQAKGVAAAAKHFPGLGAASASQNTDEEPVTLEVSLDELRSVDEGPYRSAIAAGVDMVMASWAVYPDMDARPAGLSGKWITDELRGRLGFGGVTITDAIGAGAVKGYGLAETALLAAEAGMDLLLCTQQSQGDTVRKAIYDGMRSGRLDNVAFDATTKRISELRSRIAA